jgi:hypothetical protein
MPDPTGPHTTGFWTRVIRNVIFDAHSDFMDWDSLLTQINRLITMRKKYDSEIVYAKQLPEEYLIAIPKFWQL